MRIPIEHEISLVNLLQAAPYNALPKPIQYGMQYELESGVYCNFQHSKRTPDEFKFYVQNHTANQEQADTIEGLALRISIPD